MTSFESYDNMNRIFLLFLLLIYSTFLFSAEVTLRSENVFICDLLEENPNYILILFQDKKYKIPKKEILSVNPNYTGKHTQYQNTILVLNDGTSVKGLLAEETKEMVTLKKSNELMAIPRDSIVDLKKPTKQMESLPVSYQVKEEEKTDLPLVLGYYGLGFKNGHRLKDDNYASYGGGLFIEPAFLKLSPQFLFGIQSEYIVSSGLLSYSFFQNFFYGQFNHVLFGLNFYYKLGVGSSYITLTENGFSVNTLKPAATFETGWQTSITDKFILRIGIRGNGIYERPEVMDMIGVQVSFGYKL